jgi:hypothetical protein
MGKNPRKRVNPDDFRKLDDFAEGEKAPSANDVLGTPTDMIENKGKKKNTNMRKAMILEQIRRPEIQQVFREAEKKVLEGVTEKTATVWLAERLEKEAGVRRDLICSLIMMGKKQSEVWKRDPSNMYKWLSDNLKDPVKVANGRRRSNAKSEAGCKVVLPDNQEVKPTATAPQLPDKPIDCQAIRSGIAVSDAVPNQILAGNNSSKTETEGLLENIPADSEIRENNHPRVPLATFLLSDFGESVFRTSVSAAL